MQRFVRQIALLALFAALLDGGRLLGVGSRAPSPVDVFGLAGFVAFGSFTVLRLFAAVGMWIHSNWGTALLFLTTFVELLVIISGVINIDVGLLGFILRLVLFGATLLMLYFEFRAWRQSVHD